MAMPFKLVTTVLASFAVLLAASSPNHDGFIYHGFKSSNLSLDGSAVVTKNGLLQVTNNSLSQRGLAFHPNPIIFKSTSNSSAFSFSTHIVFTIAPELSGRSAYGIVFVIAPAKVFPGAFSSIFLGLFNMSSNGNPANHVFAVELDTVQNVEFNDINDNHVGIDLNSLNSTVSTPAGYHASDKNSFRNLTLGSSKPMQLWVEYDGVDKRINVTLAPIKATKPNIPLLSLRYDLSSVLKQTMYVGFSATTAVWAAGTSHFVLGWSFKTNGTAPPIDLSRLPELPRFQHKKVSRFFILGLLQICVLLLLVVIFGVAYYLWRKRKFAEVLEEWELAYGPHRFKFKDLYIATKGFKEKELLGEGGFGQVYKGVLPTNNMEIAVKKISHQTRQGMREFIAEIVSIGRLRHRNLVPLLGYCRRKGELLLVYEFMSNGSLDSFLYNQPKSILSWSQRLQVIKGVASGLLYLHEEWEQMVIHRDVKASNVLLDSELNGRLGDFGLARLYDHGTLPQTTHIVGTIGYLAPEQSRTGKATKETDVYAFGVFLLEVACGRRPIDREAPAEKVIMVDWVDSCCKTGDILQAVDQKLCSQYAKEQAELVLKLGLLCSHSEPSIRPSMRQVLLYLEGSTALPEVPISAVGFGFNDITLSPSFSGDSSIAESVLSSGR